MTTVQDRGGARGPAHGSPSVTLVLVLVIALLGASACLGGDDGPDREDEAPSADPSTRSEGPSTSSSRPAARALCGTRRLDGPRRPPSDAQAVRPSQDIAALARRARPGTTFWLAPGLHRLEPGEFSQVIPKTGQTFIGAPGAILDGGRHNRYAFGGHAENVTIAHLTIRRFGGRRQNLNEGVVNHDAAPGWTIRSSTVAHNAGAGVMVGTRNRLLRNCLKSNGQYGFNAFHRDGVRNVLLRGNEIVGNNTDDWEARYEGCGCTGGGKFWDTAEARVTHNWIHDNRGVGLWADTNNRGFLFEHNVVSRNDSKGIIYETSYNARFVRNTFSRNGWVDGPEDPGFPTAALYLSESGGDDRVGGSYSGELAVLHNRFLDNWSAVIGWENADRFAGSPANTSTGSSTLVNPTVATVEACGDPGLIRLEPYIDDCRWKTQNLRVEGNLFRHRPEVIGPACRVARACGFVGLFSNWGTFPPWSPYREDFVERAITFEQDNQWSDNRYVGPWSFMVLEQGNRVGWRRWRSEPYGQDAGSVLVR